MDFVSVRSQQAPFFLLTFLKVLGGIVAMKILDRRSFFSFFLFGCVLVFSAVGCGPIHEDGRLDIGSFPDLPASSDDPAEVDDVDGEEPSVDGPVTFAFLVDNVFSKADYNCVGCHASNGAFDFNELNEVETALAKGENMSGLDRDSLDGNIFYVKTLDDYDDDPVFGGLRMPRGGDPISQADRDLIEDWVEAGGDI